MTEIHVEVPEQDHEPEPEPATVVVADTQTAHECDHEIYERLVRLEADNETLRREIAEAASRAFVAEAQAELAEEVAAEAIEEAEAEPEPEPEPEHHEDEEPHREHWFYRQVGSNA